MAATVWDVIGLYAVVELWFDINVTVIAKTQERNKSILSQSRQTRSTNIFRLLHTFAQ